MKQFNVVIYWNNENQLIVQPTPLACYNLIPIRAFTNGEYECRLYTPSEVQVSMLKTFPIEGIASYLIHETARREIVARKIRIKR